MARTLLNKHTKFAAKIFSHVGSFFKAAACMHHGSQSAYAAWNKSAMLHPTAPLLFMYLVYDLHNKYFQFNYVTE